MQNEETELSIEATIARADQAARTAIAAMRQALSLARSERTLAATFERSALVLERLDEADIHVVLAQAARHPHHADAHASLAQSLAVEALTIASTGSRLERTTASRLERATFDSAAHA